MVRGSLFAWRASSSRACVACAAWTLAMRQIWRRSIPIGYEGQSEGCKQLRGSLRIQIARQVLEPAVHRHRDDRLAGAQLARELQRRDDVESRRGPGKEAFLARQRPRHLPSL